MVPPEYGGHAVDGKYDTTGVSHTAPASDPDTAQRTWTTCARALASQPRMRLADTRGKRPSYPGRLSRKLVDELPSVPTAVHVYDKRGYTRMWPLDLDAHEGTAEQVAAVEADLAAVHTLLDEAGFVHLTDRAHGGRHCYVLLAEPASADEIRSLTEALAARFPTLDPSPTRSASDGLITVPGTRHWRGGHRTLTIALPQAQEILSGPWSPPTALRRLHLELADELRAVIANDRERGEQHRETLRSQGAQNTLNPREVLAITDRGLGRQMNAHLAELARDGDWRAHGYPSASEARRAVLMSAIATGLRGPDVAARMQDGRWPGLRSLFDHKGLHRFHGEYDRAAQEIARREASSTLTSENAAHASDTSAPTHSGGGGNVPAPSERAHGFTRTWRSLLHAHAPREYPGAAGWKHQQVLRALASNAHMIGSRVTATGVRWIAVATGLSRTTTAEVLYELSRQDDPWIELVARGRGRLAHTYSLRIPQRHAEAAGNVRWVSGKAHAVRPVFTVLGIPAALLYEAIEHGHSESLARLTIRTGLSREAVRQGLQILADWNLIDVSPTAGWHLTSNDADLHRLAELLGAISARANKLKRYALERQRYWELLERLSAGRQGPKYVREIETEPPPDILSVLDELRQDDLAS